MRVGVLTGGGDAPGLNAAIRAIARCALAAGNSVVGVHNGWAGLTGEGDIGDITRHDIFGILQLGGTILGSSRVNPMNREGGLAECRANLDAAEIDALVAIGGDDTLRVAAWLAEHGTAVVGVPKTMDNDLSVTDYCIGFDSAVNIVTEALDRLHTTAASHHRVMVVEVMGRDTGWVAVMGGLAGGADMILIPEYPVGIEEVVAHLGRRRAQGSHFSIIVVSEGVELAGMDVGADETSSTDAFGHTQLGKRGVGERLAAMIQASTGNETRATVLGYTQRGGSPTAYDRIWATRVGAAAYHLAATSQWGMMPVARGGLVEIASISDVVAEQRRVPADLYELAKIFF